jgi:hypothetical protein
MQPAEEFSTLVHEIAHEMLHRGDRRTLTTKQVRETEAEAVAFVVCQSVGLQNGTSSQDYIQLWHGDANLLRESLEAVQQTAAVILGGIAPEPAALAAPRSMVNLPCVNALQTYTIYPLPCWDAVEWREGPVDASRRSAKKKRLPAIRRKRCR